jgi:hypothetical protein
MKMKCITIIVISLFLFVTTASKLQAQRKVFISGHGLYAAPVDNNFHHLYDYGLGVDGTIGVGRNKTFLTGTIGYTWFKSSGCGCTGDLSYIPLKIGVRHFVFSKTVYLHADAGVASVSASGVSSQAAFTADGGIGVKLAHLELQADYDGYSRSNPSGYASWIALKAGFSFGL